MMKRMMRKIFAVFYVISSIAVCGIFSGAFCFLPNQMHLLAGQEQKIALSLPISAEFTNENIGVVSVDQKPVEGNIHLNLANPVSVKPEQSGKTEVSLSLFGVIPLKKVDVDILPKTEVVPCGNIIGVELDTEGLMVLGTGFVNTAAQGVCEPAKGILNSGDMILSANGKQMESKEDFIHIVEESDGMEISLTVKRDGAEQALSITPQKSSDDNKYKVGIWIRDSTQGLGTLTYYNPDNGHFGALGHGVFDVDTKQLMTVKSGEIVDSAITGIKKGQKGEPGEVLGELNKKVRLGSVKNNSAFGIYGLTGDNWEDYFATEKMEIALQQDVQEGPAVIRSNVIDGKMKEYDVAIESINRFSANADKGMVIRITDPKLLEETNGIIQGMSGSPVIQNGRIVGAVTHVFVQEPEKGYGIFIENMLKEESSIAA